MSSSERIELRKETSPGGEVPNFPKFGLTRQASFHDSEVKDIRSKFSRIDTDGSGELLAIKLFFVLPYRHLLER